MFTAMANQNFFLIIQESDMYPEVAINLTPKMWIELNLLAIIVNNTRLDY